MKIEIKNYIIEQEINAPDKFNLIKKIQRQKIGDGTIHDLKGEFYEDKYYLGYGMTLQHVIDLVISDQLMEKNDIVSLKSFIEEYRKLKNELHNTIKL